MPPPQSPSPPPPTPSASSPRLSPQTPSPTAPTTLQRTVYSSLRSPRFSTNVSQWPILARRNIPAANFAYVHDSAGTGSTCKANTSAFDRYRLRPSMLVNATQRDMSVSLFKGKYQYGSPIIVGPVGVQEIVHAAGELATARACRRTGIPMVLSTAATRTIEQVAQALDDPDNDPPTPDAATTTGEKLAAKAGRGDRWYQLYWPKSEYEDVTASLLTRAKTAGYDVLVVTLDTFQIGWRPADLDTAYLPFLYGQGCAIGFSDPVFNARFEESLRADTRGTWEKVAEVKDLLFRPATPWGALKVLRSLRRMQRAKMWLDVMNSGTYRDWNDLRLLRDLWGHDRPIVLKGIQTVSDARRAVEAGVDGIVVSNHGGRQLDGAVASLDALRDISADEVVRESGMEILFDSGIRMGVDVLKALALGAKAVLVGRSYMYGLGMGGAEGVEWVLRCLLAEVDNGLGQMGKRAVSDLSREDLEIVLEKAKL